MIEQDYSFLCPHCGVALSARLDLSGGTNQKFIQDCETCCKPIEIIVSFENGEVLSFSAEASD